MIGALPRYDQAPVDYRHALDAAMSLLAGHERVSALSHFPEINAEIVQRLTIRSNHIQATAGLWVEPLQGSWQNDLTGFAERLMSGSPLVVVVSQPLARLAGIHLGWPESRLGVRLGGLQELRRSLTQAGFLIVNRYGIHSANAILINQISHLAARWNRPDLADRLEFAARLRYSGSSSWTTWATMALWLARRN